MKPLPSLIAASPFALAIALAISLGVATADAAATSPNASTAQFKSVSSAMSEIRALALPRVSEIRKSVTFDVVDGPLKGTWVFSGGDFQVSPTRYVHYRMIPGDLYQAEKTVVCEDSQSICDAFRSEFLAAPPPPPPPPPGPGYVVAPDEQDIFLEACWVKPLSQESAYPEELKGTGTSGEVGLILAVNKCGDVGRVAIGSSSGNEILDRAAVEAAQHWVVSVPQFEPGRGGLVKVNVQFIDDTPLKAEPGATSVP